ncbi:MAG: hypothetical protein KAG96_05370 [Ichthyobacteriaceae bacterium]|nr:hypothetical protein [Ichthyobacteriaceae bacterium]
MVEIIYADGSTKKIRTKLSDEQKIIKFLKLTGDWSSSIIKINISETQGSVCSYQNIEE